MRLVWPLVAFALLPSAKAQQQVIECGVPKRMGDGIRPTYDSGEVVPMQWKSTWPLFNLTIVQVSSATQVKFRDQVFRNEPNTTANYLWTAENLEGLSQNDPFHVWITNAKDSQCETCSCRSTNFTVLNPTSSATSSTSGSSPTATSPLASSTASAESSSGNGTDHVKLGLGLGLGLGIPLLVIITALVTWLCARGRRERRRRSLTTESHHDIPPKPAYATIPLSSAAPTTTQFDSDWSSDGYKKSPAQEMDSHEVIEMQTDTGRVEAPLNADRAELVGDEGLAKIDESKVPSRI